VGKVAACATACLTANLNLLEEAIMKKIQIKKYIYIPVLLLSMGPMTHAATLNVNCGAKAGLSSITAAIKALKNVESRGSSTINVAGACNEDVLIQSMDRLTLNAMNGASINDPSGGNVAAVTIDDSRDVTVSGFTINGGADGIDCQNGSLCRLIGNIVENSPNDGIGVWTFSQAEITGGTLVGNGFCGLQIANGARGRASNVTVRSNWRGVIVNNGAFLGYYNAAVRENPDVGVWVAQGAVFVCSVCSITANGGDGVHAEQGSTVRFQTDFGVPSAAPYRVMQNGGAGVSLTNLANVSFFGGDGGGGNVSENQGPLDVVCNASFTAAGGLANAGVAAGRTNCAGP
jgi:Right handed beta helix region